jgi:hypothetical protein
MRQSAAIRSFVTVAFLLAFLIILLIVRADEWSQATLFTFSQPVQIPGQVLPAGTYLFEIINDFKAAIVLAERGVSQPEAIVAWSYPGRVEGHQFLYPKQVQEEVAKDKQDTFVFGD